MDWVKEIEGIAEVLSKKALGGDPQAAIALLSCLDWLKANRDEDDRGAGTPARGPRPGHTPPGVVERILSMRQAGMSFPGIAKQLNAEGVPTAGGGREWYPTVVRSIVLRHGGS